VSAELLPEGWTITRIPDPPHADYFELTFKNDSFEFSRTIVKGESVIYPFMLALTTATPPPQPSVSEGSVPEEIAALVSMLAQAQKPLDPDVARILREHWDELFDEAPAAPRLAETQHTTKKG
jgi:hypothetical protein